MKKLTIAITLLLVLAFSVTTLAEGIEIYASKTYNMNYYSLAVGGAEAEIPESMSKYLFDTAKGYDAGGIFWISDRVGIGVGVEGFENSRPDVFQLSETAALDVIVHQQLIGVQGSLYYSLNKYLTLFASRGFYTMKFIGELNPTTLIEAVTFEGSGFIFGADLSIPVREHVWVFGSAGYRYTTLGITAADPITGITLDEPIDLTITGYVFSGGVSLSF